MSRRSQFEISSFECPGCGKRFPLPRKMKQRRKKGHIKTLYCPFCNKMQDFTEYQGFESCRTLSEMEMKV